MLVHVHQQSIGGVSSVIRPEVGLTQPDAVEGLARQAVATVGQRLRVGKDPAKRIDCTRVSLDVGGGAEVVRRVSGADADGGAVGEKCGFGGGGHRSSHMFGSSYDGYRRIITLSSAGVIIGISDSPLRANRSGSLVTR